MYEEAIADDARYYFAVRRTDNKTLIGTLEVEVGSEEVPSTLRGLVIAQSERGRGYGRAALELIEGFLVDEHGATALTAEVPGGFDDGERFLEAVGFRERRLRSGETRWLKRLDSE
jgi:RimJ/RimL family protein N-acetyltransferase